MFHHSVVPSNKSALSPSQVLQLTNLYLDVAYRVNDHDIALVFCQHAEAALYQVKGGTKKSSTTDPEERVRLTEIATAYYHLGELLKNHGHEDVARTFFKKSEKWSAHAPESSHLSKSTRPPSIVGSIKSVNTVATVTTTTTTNASGVNLALATSPAQSIRVNYTVVSAEIFPMNVAPPTFNFNPPDPDARLIGTLQLACCLGLLQETKEADEIKNTVARNWLKLVKDEPDEHERLKTLATDVIRVFKRDEFKDTKAVTEVVYLAPVLENDDFRYLLKEFYSGIESSTLLDIHQLEGLAQLIQGADTSYLDADDLVKVLDLFSTRLQATHQQSVQHVYQLTLAVSHVLDAMADAEVKGLDRETIHEPLLSYLEGLKGSSDPYLVFQAAYAYQALLCVPDNETLWQATVRRTGKVIQGISGLVSAVKGLDLNEFINGLGNIQQGIAGASEVVQIVKSAYEGASSLAKSGQGFLKCLKEGLSFNRKCAWYPALRGADTMIQEGRFFDFKTLVCEAPCRHDAAFQWGVCQRLGEIAVNTMWDRDIRDNAVAFLGEIYRNDSEWGQQATVKQWILDILMQLSSQTGKEVEAAESLLQELQSNGDTTKQDLYRECRENGPGSHPLKVGLTAIGSPSLLDRVQERPVVEGNIRQLRRQRLKEHGDAVYIPLQAKAGLQTRDETRFPLMEKVNDFLTTNQTVFLLLGDSGAGKSTFNRQLECHLWEAYKKSTGVIPLYISLPAIEKPEHDMIAKQLRRCEFTEPQIRELKLHRTFVLICDGYDESQQTHNLYTSNRLNEPGEWSAKMVISCRSEYIGVDYRDRFQPGDRNQRAESALFQEAVITPFSWSQVQEYIDQFVSVHRPLWEANQYKRALDRIPSLKELVKNPFLMSLSLEVLPRVVDPGENLSTTRITRVALYDQFIEHWLERGKKRLGEKNLSPQARAAFESLSDEGFVPNGVDFLKRLSKAIYKNQGGQPIVRYSRYKDENTWKSEFFSREDEKQLLREACPLVRNGNQHHFIHRSLLEYGVALAVFDPQEWKDRMTAGTSLARRGSISSTFSFDVQDSMEGEPSSIGHELDPDSPLVWRYFVNEPSVLQFLEERVQQAPLFKQQLLDYIEQSKGDKKWRIAASNAITILVRVGVQFNGADLRGIQIPKADLSYGVFDSVQLQGADLRLANLQAACLRRANLSNVQMTGARFGELPYLEQDSNVSMCAYSPDGKSISIVLENRFIKVYSTSTWEEMSTLRSHSGGIMSMVYSPKSNQIASGSKDKTARLWDIEKGVSYRILSGHNSAVQSVAYSPGGDQVVTGSNDSTIRLWDVESGVCTHILIGHRRGVNNAVYSPKGDYIISSSDTMRLWHVKTKEYSQVLRGHDGSIHVVVYSPQGNQVASGGDDKTARLWDATTGECLHVLRGHDGPIGILTYPKSGDQIATSCSYGDKTVRLWDTATGMCLHTLFGHAKGITSIAYSPQWNLIASASNDRTVRLWDTETGMHRQILTGHSGSVQHIAFSPKGDQIASGSADKTIRLWDIGTGTSRHVSSGHHGWVRKVKFSPKGDQLATCSLDSTARLWDVETGMCRHVLRGHTNTVIAIAYSPHENQLATGSWDNTARLWSTETGVCVYKLSDHSDSVLSVAYSPNGDQLATASDDRTVRLWNVATGECQHVLPHQKGIFNVAYSPTDNQIASGCRNGSMYLWCAETGSRIRSLDGHHDKVNCILYTPQGDLAVSISNDWTARLWDVATGGCRHVFEGYSGKIRAIAYSPKGHQIAYGCLDGSVKLMDATSGICLHTLEGHDREVESIIYSPCGDLVITGGMDKTARMWDVASGQCKAMIEGFQGKVNDIALVETSNYINLAAGCHDGFVGMWQLRVEGEHIQSSLRWRTTKSELTVDGTSIQDAAGLNQLNRKLLEQRGAVGDPVDDLREASKKVVSMASVVSRLKSGRINMVEDQLTNVDPPSDEPEQEEV